MIDLDAHIVVCHSEKPHAAGRDDDMTDEVSHRQPSPWNDEWTNYMFLKAIFDVEEHLIDRFTPEVQERIDSTFGYLAERTTRHG